MHFHPALGDPEGLHERERGLFESEGFPTPSASTIDRWRREDVERAQTFTDYLESDAPLATPPHRQLHLLPVAGRTRDDRSLDRLRALFAAFFQLDSVVDAAVELSTNCTAPVVLGAERHPFAGELQQSVRQRMSSDTFATFSLSIIPLSPEPDLALFLGQSYRLEQPSIFSFTPLPALEDTSRFLHLASWALHESCHVFGLRHCPYFVCLMNPVSDVKDLVDRPLSLCPVCLRKLAWSVGFDVRQRYRALAGTCSNLGFHREANFCRERLAGTPGAFPIEWSPA